MKFCVLALDFDGTIAWNDTLDPAVREAIAELRSQGIVVILVTGRILEDLRRVAGGLHFVDCVVAENGAVVAFPDSGYSVITGSGIPQDLIAELRRQGIAFLCGQSLLEAAASTAPQILQAFQKLELPLTLAFNRSRVMVLPQAISKATGLRRALTILRLSPHNAIGIGDAENDHELLHACEAGLAVAWGSQALQASADYVLPGDGPHAVAPYVRSLAASGLIPTPVKTRRRLMIGHAHDGQPMEIAVRGRNVLIAGDSKSGKSWVAGLLCEQLILYGYALCILDPEGDYTSLEALPGVTVLGGADPLPRPRDLLRALRHADSSLVIDLSHRSHHERYEYVRSALPALATLRRSTGLPHRIVVDEAHYFLNGSDIGCLLDLQCNGYTLITYRTSMLHPDVLSASQAVIVTRESDPNEVRALHSLCRVCENSESQEEIQDLLESLVVGEAALLPLTSEGQGKIRRIRLAPRLTPHVRHLAKYIDIPVPKERGFAFWRDGLFSGERATTLQDFVSHLESFPASAFDGHLRRKDFSRWIAEVFGDYPLSKTVRKIEDEYQPAGTSDIVARVAQAIRSRYEFVDVLAGPCD